MSLRRRLDIAQEDLRGTAQMSPADLVALGVRPGDTVALEAAGTGYARAVPAQLPEGVVRCDRATAGNARAAAGEAVAVAARALPRLASVMLRLGGRRPIRPADLEDALFDRAVALGDRLVLPLPGGGRIEAEVEDAAPAAVGLVDAATTISLARPAAGAADYEQIGGMADQIARVHEMISTPLARPELFARLGVPPPRGVLFCGPPGSGKTLLARTVAARSKASFFHIDAPEIVSKHYGDSEAALRRVFAAAEKAQPAIIFIDEIDAIAPRRTDLSSEKQVERRVVAQLLTLMDGLSDRGRVVVMAATNLPDALDPALRRPGRFDRELRFAAPRPEERRQILDVHLARAPLADDVDLDGIAARAHGYVGADLASLAREAGMAALERAIAAAGGEAAVEVESLTIAQADLEAGLQRTAPSALRADRADTAGVDWSSVGGLEDIRNALQQAILWPRRHPGVMASLGLAAPRGVLLTGPPGSGKTLLARALAREGDLNFVPVRAPMLLSQYLGEAERSIAALFDRAREAAPSLLFFDELDALAPRRGASDAVFDRMVAQLLVELDGIAQGNGVAILAATNRPGAIDPALLRPGRFDLVLQIGMPDAAARAAILSTHLATRPRAPSVDIAALARETDGMTGADLAAIVDAAGWSAFRRIVSGQRDGTRIEAEDLFNAVAAVRAAKTARSADFLNSQESA